MSAATIRRSQHSHLYIRAEGGSSWIAIKVNGSVTATWEMMTETTSRSGQDAEMNLFAGYKCSLEFELLDDTANTELDTLIEAATAVGGTQVEIWATNGDITDTENDARGPEMLSLVSKMDRNGPGLGNNKNKFSAIPGFGDTPLQWSKSNAA